MIPVIDGLLKEIFPRENYKNAGKPMVLHYWIALGQPNDNIIDWVQKNPQWINFHNALHLDLSPLMVSVLKGNNVIAKFLLNQGADYTIADHKGWTAIHHAVVVGNAVAFDLLKNRNNVNRLCNFLKANHLDLKSLISVKPAEDQVEVFFLREAGKTTKCTAQKFKEITGASYSSSVIVKPEQLMISWKNPPVEVLSFLSPDYLENEYQSYLKAPPKISLGKLEPDAPQGFDVFAEETISAFKGITIYAGALENSVACTDYLLDGVDGTNFRNLGPMINDGFPNCTSVPVVVKGFLYYIVLSLREIKPGERLYWNYGITHTIKLGGIHLELNKDELIAYANHINKNGTPDCKKLLEQNKIFQYLYEKEKLKYLLETPSALIYLLSQSAFPINAFGFLASKNWEIFNELLLDKGKYSNQIQCALSCGFIENALQTIDGLKEVRGEVRALLFKWSETLLPSLVINYLIFFLISLKKIQSTPDWNHFKSDLDDYVSFMEALHKFSSKFKMDHIEFFPKIKSHYLKLGKEKQQEGLNNIKTYAAGMDDQKRRDLLNQLLEELRASYI